MLTEGAGPLPAELQRDYRRALAESVGRYERRICVVGVAFGSAMLVTILAQRASGVAIPTGIPFLLAGLIAWYGVSWLALRAHRYLPWWRYVSTTLESMFPTAVFLVDAMQLGPTFALGAAGPLLYPVAAVVAVLRLDWRLPLLSGVLGSLQHLAVVLLVIRPLVPPERHAEVGLQGFSTISKTLLILAAGVFGVFACRGLQHLSLRVVRSSAERNRIRGLLGMHVGPEVMETLLAGGVSPAGTLQTVTVCFTDIRNFTAFCETRRPAEVVTFLNLYFERMCAVVDRHGGVVNKFMGDGMLVIFGAPHPVEEDARRALDAAIEMTVEVERLRNSGEFPELRVGIGLHRGEAIVGAVGSSQRREYTVIGDVVNTAARVQALTKEYGVPVLLTAEVMQQLGAIPVQHLGVARVRGKEERLELFAPRLASS